MNNVYKWLACLLVALALCAAAALGEGLEVIWEDAPPAGAAEDAVPEVEVNLGGDDGTVAEAAPAPNDENYYGIDENGVLVQFIGSGDVVVPDGVKAIGNYVFAKKSLDSVTLPDSVERIGDSAFSGSTMEAITLSRNLQCIGEWAFANTNLESVDLPDGLTTVGDGAFCGCRLESVRLPASLTSLGERAFEGTRLGSVVLPSKLSRIEFNTFYDCPLTSVTIPNGIREIGLGAFGECALTTVSLPDSVTVIEDEAFYNCSLNTVRLSASLETVGKSAFENNPLKALELPASLREIGESAFRSLGITEVTIPAGVEKIGGYAFYKCASLRKVTILSRAAKGETWMFDDCSPDLVITVKCGTPALEQIRQDQERCGFEINVIDHTRVTLPAVAPTYTTTGLTEGEKCSVCGTVFKAQQVVPKLELPEGGVLVTGDLSRKMEVWDSFTIVLNCVDAASYETSDASVATVSDVGAVFAKRAGVATVTVRTVPGDTFRLSLTVEDPAKLSATAASLNVGDQKALEVSGTKGRSVAWTSSEPKVATVSDKGVVKAVKAGKCAVAATLENGRRLECSVTVTDPAKLSKTKLSLDLGKKTTLKATGLAGRKVTWKSSKPKVATVSSKGVVRAVSAGKCTITAQVKGGKALKCAVKVVDAAKLSSAKLKLGFGEKSTLKVSGLAGRKVTWKSSKPKVATVSSKGVVKGLKKGKSTVTAKVKGGKTLKCVVTVYDAAALSDTSLNLTPGTVRKLSLSGLAGRSVKWSSTNPSVASVSGKGGSASVTAHKNGQATIKAVVKGGKTLKCTVLVQDPVTVKVVSVTASGLAGYKNANVLIQNNSARTVSCVTMEIDQYDAHGSRLTSPFAEYKYEGNIGVHGAREASFWVSPSTAKASCRVKRVEFSDGSSWTP